MEERVKRKRKSRGGRIAGVHYLYYVQQKNKGEGIKGKKEVVVPECTHD